MPRHRTRAKPAFLQPTTGNLAPGQRLPPGWHPTLSYTSTTGTFEHATVTEVARWIQDHPPPPSPPAITLPPHPSASLPESPVVPARNLRSYRRAPPAPSTTDTALLLCLPIRRSRSQLSPVTMLPDTALSTPRRSPRYTAMRCATIPVASAGSRLSSPRSVSGSEPPITLPPLPRHPATPSFAGHLSGPPSLFSGCPLGGPAASPATYSRSPLPSPASQTPTWFETAESELPSTSSRSAPVLNLDELGWPLTFRSALAGPYGDLWRRANGNELIKLVETSRALTPVHTATSLPTYLNNVVKEK
jgi:hypothetical protein